jgi:hypothetical protein
MGHKRIDETMLYVHVTEAHARELPEIVRDEHTLDGGNSIEGSAREREPQHTIVRRVPDVETRARPWQAAARVLHECTSIASSSTSL